MDCRYTNSILRSKAPLAKKQSRQEQHIGYYDAEPGTNILPGAYIQKFRPVKPGHIAAYKGAKNKCSADKQQYDERPDEAAKQVAALAHISGKHQ